MNDAYKKKVEEIYQLLTTSSNGLTNEEVKNV